MKLADRYRGDLFLFGKLGMCLFERAWSIRGMDRIMVDMIERPEFVEGLLDRILYEWNLPIIDQQLAIGVDGFYFAEDWGSETALLFSPKLWRRFIKPRLAIMYERCRQAGVVVGQHSDGAVGGLFPDLIEIGLQVFNPLSTTIMDPVAYKAKWGDKLTFYGGIDVERLMPFGTPDEVRREVRFMAETMGRGRLHPANLAHLPGRRAHRKYRGVCRRGARDGRVGISRGGVVIAGSGSSAFGGNRARSAKNRPYYPASGRVRCTWVRWPGTDSSANEPPTIAISVLCRTRPWPLPGVGGKPTPLSSTVISSRPAATCTLIANRSSVPRSADRACLAALRTASRAA